jgi:hypothetical protein
MADSNSSVQASSQSSSGTPLVPDEARKKHPEIVELILHSESMNLEEQNYWLQVLPIMTTEQVLELKDILDTEKKKLAEIDAKYAPQTTPEKSPADLEAAEKKRKEALAARKAAEEKSRAEENASADALLGELSSL